MTALLNLYLHLNTRTRYLMAETWDLKLFYYPSQSSGLRFLFERASSRHLK